MAMPDKPMLIIAEKPKVAEKIAKFLDSGAKKKYESKVAYYELERNGRKIYVASAVGHIFSLKEANGSVGEIPVFDVKWVPAHMSDKSAGHTKDYIKALEALAKKAGVYVSACDYDIEGSLIGFNAIRFIAGTEKGKRMKFSALTKEDIIKAFEEMGELDYNNAYAGETRHILDWYWGINLSRALMQSIRNAGLYKVMSIGRVQGPTLDILVKREKEILAFKAEPFWQLHVEKDGIQYLHEKDKFWDEYEALRAYERTALSGKVKSVEKREVRVPPPYPFDLTSLQIEAYRVFKMSPKEVLQLAQNLYENSYISYPRTSSQQLPPSLGLKGILERIAKIDDYSKEARFLLSNNLLKPKDGPKSDPAHPAIHPTGIHGKMGEREKKLYDLIVRRFLACFGEGAVKESTKVTLDMGGEHYIGKGMVVKKDGWIQLYGRYYAPEEERLPLLESGQEFRADRKHKEKKMTQPPKRYTPTSLVKALEKSNLGTKATRATIIDTLFKRDYVRSESIEVSEYGMKVHEVLHKYCPEILDEKLTRSFEEKIEKIQEGKEQEERVLGEAREVLKKIIKEFMQNDDKIGPALVEAFRGSERKKNFIMKCDKCGKDLVIKNTRDGRIFIGCTGWPACNNAYPVPNEVKKVGFVKKCPKCGGPVIKYRMRKITVVRCAGRTCDYKE